MKIKKLVSVVAALAMLISLAAIPVLADDTTPTLAAGTTNGVTITESNGVYSWDFSGATEKTNTVGTGSDGVTGSTTTNQYYNVGGGLSVHNLKLYQTDSSTSNSTSGTNDIFGNKWVPESGNATRYVKFTPSSDGVFSFTIKDNNGSYRAYYTDDGNIPTKVSHAVYGASSDGAYIANLYMAVGKTYIIALYSYNSDASINSIKFDTTVTKTTPYNVTATSARQHGALALFRHCLV